MVSQMRCHYEVLGVERNVDADGLKKAYRKMALRWHPDKNQDALEEAEVRFKEINAAHEVLSDPQERAWYDNHRESILAGGDGTSGGDGTVVPTPNLWAWFRSSCYEGFGDDEKGFYAVYQNAFEEVLKVERESGLGTIPKMPAFGTSTTPGEEVERFYSAWSGFVSSLSFGWADIYNPNEVANNRYQRRIVEKENKRARDAARREYNEQVRSLVNYARRRDQRVLALQRERQRQKEEREKARLEAAEAKKEARRAAQKEWFKVQQEEEERIRQEEEATGQKVFRLADDDDDNEKEAKVWVCEACSKTFKSDKQYKNHEVSKKHKEMVKKLQKRLEEEERAVMKLLAEEEAEFERELEREREVDRELERKRQAELNPDLEQDEEEDLASLTGGLASTTLQEDSTRATSKEGATAESGSKPESVSDSDSNADSDSDSSGVDFGAFGRVAQSSDDEEESSEEVEEEEENSAGAAAEQNSDDSGDSHDCVDDDGAVVEQEGETAESATCDALGEDSSASPQPKKSQTGKKKTKNKASKASSGPSPTDEVTEYWCATCSSYFESRNQLFKHLKATNHSAPPDAIPSKAPTKGKRGKKKNRG